jgi:hypothetical protein
MSCECRSAGRTLSGPGESRKAPVYPVSMSRREHSGRLRWVGNTKRFQGGVFISRLRCSHYFPITIFVARSRGGVSGAVLLCSPFLHGSLPPHLTYPRLPSRFPGKQIYIKWCACMLMHLIMMRCGFDPGLFQKPRWV